MSLGVTKECFPPASKCHNCKRKSREDIIEKNDERKEFLRCSGCHFLTYCDKNCQIEHWEKVHKRHCKFLSGRKPLENSGHNEDSCAICIEDKNADVSEILDFKSPKTGCHIELMINKFKKVLGCGFEFHREGKTCTCSLDFPCELLFPLGEVTGKYIGIGLDGMLAHAIKIASAMCIKGKNIGDKNETIPQLWNHLIIYRSGLWGTILIYGVPKSRGEKITQKYLVDPVKELKVFYGASNAWWKALMFSVDDIVNMNEELASDLVDSKSMENPIFSNFKLVHDYNQSQSRYQGYIENNLWPKFKLWPSLSGDSLVILLPDGTRCHICNSALSGDVIVTEDELLTKVSKEDGIEEVTIMEGECERFRPMIMSRLGENGELVACCSAFKNTRCILDCIKKDVNLYAQKNEDQRKKNLEENKTLLVMSRDCDMCLKKSLSSHRCSDCYAAQYCSTQCQIEDLKFHKTVCSTWAKDKFRKIINAKQQKKVFKSQADEYFK